MAKILLVEDNEMNRDMLLRRLQRRDFDVVVAVDVAALPQDLTGVVCRRRCTRRSRKRWRRTA